MQQIRYPLALYGSKVMCAIFKYAILTQNLKAAKWIKLGPDFHKSTSVVMGAGNMSFVEAIMVCFFLPRVRNAIMNFWLDSISSPELSLDKGNEDSGDEVGLDLVSEVPDKIPSG